MIQLILILKHRLAKKLLEEGKVDEAWIGAACVLKICDDRLKAKENQFVVLIFKYGSMKDF